MTASTSPAPKTGLFCFLNKDRECSADCMAFIQPPVGIDYQDQQWAYCLLLVSAHRSGKHLVVLADTTGKMLNLTKNKQADEARANQPPPPTVK